MVSEGLSCSLFSSIIELLRNKPLRYILVLVLEFKLFIFFYKKLYICLLAGYTSKRVWLLIFPTYSLFITMAKFKNKYRIESHRKSSWAYSNEALYFLTLVTQHRACCLGEIVVDVSQQQDINTPSRACLLASNFGTIVEKEWHKSFEIRLELRLDEFIMMPNHLHAIVGINRADIEDGIIINDGADTVETHNRNTVETHGSSSLRDMDVFIKRNPAIRLPQSISSFIAGFKSAVNTKIDDYIDAKQLDMAKYNRRNHFFQPNYHDHIIRNEWEYWRIKNYIISNPDNWIKDKFNEGNV